MTPLLATILAIGLPVSAITFFVIRGGSDRVQP